MLAIDKYAPKTIEIDWIYEHVHLTSNFTYCIIL